MQDMITRAMSSATTGLLITTGLLFGMQLLIATGEEIITEPRQRHILEWVRLVEDLDPIVEIPLLPKIDKPPVPPTTSLPDSEQSGGVGVELSAAPPAPQAGRATVAGLGVTDGPLINIFKVQPRYPIAAQTKGLEGTVIVQFDVSPLGTVENVVVIESSNNIFNKAAIEAAYRFKYRPKVVDGTNYGVRGLQQLFRFEMEE